MNRLRSTWAGAIALTNALIMTGLLGLAVPEIATATAAAGLEGRPVTRIEVLADAPGITRDRVEPLIVPRAGGAFRQDDVARTLRNLQASGLVSEAEAFVEAEPEGVAITFATWGRIQVERIIFEGDLEVRQRDLRGVLAQGEGEPLVTSRILRGVYDLETYYQRLGFLAASVRARPQIDRENKTAVVIYEIDPGSRFKVREVSFEGPIAPFTAEQLEGHLKMGPGKTYLNRGARADTERLETWLFSQNHRVARVGPFDSAIDWEEAFVDLTYQIDVGPRFLIEIHGADERRLRRKGLLPFLKDSRYDEAILLRSVERIRTHYQRQGYFDVDVSWEESRTSDLVHLVLTVDLGSRYQLAEIGFVGNEVVGTETLRSLISTEPRRLFSSSSGRLSESVLEEDLENILSFYRINGYWDAVVGPAEINQDAGELRVTIPIEEGVQRRLVNLQLDGVSSVDESALRLKLPLQEGGPFHPILQEETTSAIRAFYRSRGFASVQLDARVDWDSKEILADLSYRILEGPRSVVDRVVIRGNRRTQSQVIRDALDLRPGEFFSSDRLLEAQTNLHRLGAFSSVDVRQAPGTPFSGERDILVDVEEGSRHSFTYGFGLDTEEGFTGLLGYTRSNMLGRGVTGRLDLRLGRDTLARVLLNQPFFGRRRITTTGSLFYIEETRDSFESLRRGGQVEAQRIGKHSRTGLLFDYRQVDILEFEGFDPGEVDRDLEEVQIASITPNYQLNHRDDPVNPTSGWTTNLQFQYAFPLFQAQEEFLKTFVQYTHFFNLGWLGSIGGSMRVGGIEPYKDPPEVPVEPDILEDLPSALVPISERFFAGGSTTHRSYRRDRLGICGDTLIPVVAEEERALSRSVEEECANAIDYVPIGGNGQLLFNFDYRFPIAGPIGGNVFLDIGNVWSDWRDIDLSQLKNGLGLGVRYLSPIGAIRLEAGWKLDRLPGEDPYAIFFSVGNAY